jgi:hypothetical protein
LKIATTCDGLNMFAKALLVNQWMSMEDDEFSRPVLRTQEMTVVLN